MTAVIQTMLENKHPQSHAEAESIVDQATATAMLATRMAAHSSLMNVSLGGLVFRRDMLLDIPLTADLVQIQKFRQQKVDQWLLVANAHRISHNYSVGDQGMKQCIL